MSISNRHFLLYANCLPVKGASRSLLCDVQRHRTHFIPNDLYDILKEHKGKTIGEIQALYGSENAETIAEYFEFLLEEEYIFLCDADDLDLFPGLSLQWEHPSLITNAIIDVGAGSDHPFNDLFTQLEELGCQTVQIRFYRKCSLTEAIGILLLLDKSSIQSVELFMVYDQELTDLKIAEFVDAFPRITTLVLHSASSEGTIACRSRTPISLVNEVIGDASHCGFIAKGYFSANLQLFTESQQHNSCLNRKISIDEHGLIKNCPSMTKSYGNIQDRSLRSVLQDQEFVSLWHIARDQVDTCKVCEFRYICTDCRAFTNGNGKYAKPQKCDYNPYSAAWETSLL